VKPYRSMLFVPGHKSSWAEKAVAAGTDAIILDLEDSVPATDKADARKTVHETIGRLREHGPLRGDLPDPHPRRVGEAAAAAGDLLFSRSHPR